MRPTIAAIVPTYNRPHQIPLAVHHLLATNVDEIVVVLDGPQPESREALLKFAEDDRCKIVELQENVGLARARIAGLEHAETEYVLILDDDVRVSGDIVEAHIAAHADVSDRVVVGYMPVNIPARPRRGQAATRTYAREYEAATRRWRKMQDVPLSQLWNGNVSLSRSLYSAAESLAPSIPIPYNEDLDLGLRLERCGAHAVFVPEARADHDHHRSNTEILTEALNRGRGAAMLEQRWGGLPPQILDLVSRDLGGLTAIVCFVTDNPKLLGFVNCLALASLGLLGRLRFWFLEGTLYRVVRRLNAMAAYRACTSAQRTAGGTTNSIVEML
jgi:GT2 family glycosyltransferase